jgi:hypothetical protein
MPALCRTRPRKPGFSIDSLDSDSLDSVATTAKQSAKAMMERRKDIIIPAEAYRHKIMRKTIDYIAFMESKIFDLLAPETPDFDQ